jgi:hypothetical protein
MNKERLMIDLSLIDFIGKENKMVIKDKIGLKITFHAYW